MRNLIVASLCALALPLAGHAQSIGISIGQDGFFEYDDGNLYVPTLRTCNLTAVQAMATEDDAFIQNIDVLFDDGSEEYLAINNYLPPGQPTTWQYINSYNRCVIGFSIHAVSPPDGDYRSSLINLYGNETDPYNNPQLVYLGNVRLADYFGQVDWHRRNGWRDRGGWRDGGWRDGGWRGGDGGGWQNHPNPGGGWNNPPPRPFPGPRPGGPGGNNGGGWNNPPPPRPHPGPGPGGPGGRGGGRNGDGGWIGPQPGNGRGGGGHH